MLVQELKKIGFYFIVMAALVIPMLGFPKVKFQATPVLWTLGVFLALMVLGSVIKIIRGPQVGKEDKVTWTDQVRGRLNKIPKMYTLGPLAILALTFPLIGNDYQTDVIITCLTYVALGLGLNIVVGLCGLLDLGYIAFYAVGAYSYSLLNLHFGLNFWAALPFGIILGMCVGCIIGYPTLKMRGDYLAIVTMGFGEIIRLVLNNWDNLTKGPNGLFGMEYAPLYYPTIKEGGLAMGVFRIDNVNSLYYLILGIAILTIIGVRRLDHSRIGRAWVAVREDETAAELSGVPTTLIKLLAYALGAGFAAMAGAFFASRLSYTNPNFFLFMESCIVLCIVVLGGVGSIPGIIIAAFILIGVPEVFRQLESFRMLVFGGIMAFMMVVKPEGLIPAARRKRELHQSEGQHPREVEDDE